jgi:hypothetical protein
VKILNSEFNNNVNPVGEFWRGKRNSMITGSMLNVEVETVDGKRTSVVSGYQDGVDEVKEAANGFSVFQFGVSEVEKRNREP